MRSRSGKYAVAFSSAAVSLESNQPTCNYCLCSIMKTYSNSTKYGGAPNDVLRPTLTEGTAFVPSTRPRARAALTATLEAIVPYVQTLDGER